MNKRVKNGPICKVCEIRSSELASQANGKRFYKRHCKTCRKYPTLGDKLKQKHCSVCLKEYHSVCMDVDHLDGNKLNDSYTNLQIICANCHRLKSLMCHDYSTFKKD